MWRCPYCETYNEDDANFCMICGSGKNAAPAPEASSDEPTFRAPERPAPAPRPRPSNMWDNGEGLGGATDLKALAAKRAAKEYEKLELDAAVRRKMYDSGEGRDISDSFERHVEASRDAVAKESSKARIIVVLLVVLLVIGLLYAKNQMTERTPPAGADFELVQNSVAFRAGPGNDYQIYDRVDYDDSLEFLGEIVKDSGGAKWCKFSHNGLIGYIRYDYIEFE